MLHLDAMSVRPGTCLAVTGPSGCGKSTLLGILALALRPAVAAPDARLGLGGEDALAMWRGHERSLAGLRAARLGYVPQTAALLPFLTLRQNIALPQSIANRRDPAYLEATAERLGIRHVLDRRPAQVSVGQRQRAAIARALAHRPAIVLADEPTASVHPAQAQDILALLRGLAEATGVALVATTHDPEGAAAAGFAIAPCAPDGPGATRFHWTG